MSTASASSLQTIVERMGLKTLVESCLVLEEGVASAKDIEMGMMMGAGILPGPFARADEAGLDTVLEQAESAQREWGDAFEPPTILRRLVAQGRLGEKSGQGTRSATPLAWTHGQFVRLAWSIDAGLPLERPAIVACRYQKELCPSG